MSHTQAEINNIVNNIVNRFGTSSIAFPDGQYPNECTAPVVWYLEALGAPVPAMLGNRADGWGVAFPEGLTHFFTHEGFNPGKAYPKGTLLIWNSPHIAIVMSHDGSNTVEVYEQNADPDGSPCGIKSRIITNEYHQCTYALVPVVGDVAAPAEAVYVQVTPSAPPAAPVTFPGNGEPYEVKVVLQGYQSATAAGNHAGLAVPVEPGTYAIFRYYPGNQQLINITTDKTKPGWWINAADNELPEPEPTPVVTTDRYVGPRESSVPVAVPVVVEPIPDLEPEPVHEPAAPVDWKATYVPFNPGTGHGNVTNPREYKVNLPGRIWNLDETGPDISVLISKNERVHAYGTVIKDGTKYYRLKLKRDLSFDWWLCVPITFNHMAVLTLPGPTLLDRWFHRGEQLKTIFTNGEPQFLDIVKLEPFKRKRK